MKDYRNYLKLPFKSTVTYLLIALTVFKGPEIQYNYVRNKVKKTTVMITNEEKTSGGSGFHVVAPSGQTYILTNAHICALGKDGIIFITDDYGRTIPRRIIEVSTFTDLCLIESLPNYQGALKLGDDVHPGQIVSVVGHPALMPTAMNRGEIIAQSEVEIFDHAMEDGGSCNLPKNRIEDVNTMFGPVKICVVRLNANLTTVLILPGNSGSPQVDFYGNLTGVFFCC